MKTEKRLFTIKEIVAHIDERCHSLGKIDVWGENHIVEVDGMHWKELSDYLTKGLKE